MKERDFFDRKENLIRIWRVFFLCLVALVASDFFVPRHDAYAWNLIPGFYAAYGFVGCSLLVLVAKWLRRFLMRDEHYYD